MKHFITLFTLLVLAVGIAKADLVWDPQQGWYVEGGSLDPYFGNEINARNAIELMNVAREAQERKDYWTALRAYERVWEDYYSSMFAPEALFQSAKIHIARNQFDDAFHKLDQVIELYPDYSKFNQVIGQQFEVASQIMEGERPFYWGMVPGFKDRAAASEYFEGIINNAPYSRYAPVALLNIALIAKERGETEQAIDALDRLITNYPQSVLAPDAYLNIAETYGNLVGGAEYDQGSTHEAISYYEDFMLLYPNDPIVQKAEVGLAEMRDMLSRSKLLIGEFYYKHRRNSDAAVIMLNEAITIAPDTPSAERAQSLIARIEAGEEPPSTPVDWLFGESGNINVPAFKMPSLGLPDIKIPKISSLWKREKEADKKEAEEAIEKDDSVAKTAKRKQVTGAAPSNPEVDKATEEAMEKVNDLGTHKKEAVKKAPQRVEETESVKADWVQ